MRIAHLILVHDRPAQLQRLISRLVDDNADVFIHLDAKSSLQPFAGIAKLPQVYFIKNRVKVHWGAFDIIQATLNGFKEILQYERKYDYINLLSGQDYPLKSAADIHGFLSRHPGKAFMNILVAETHWQEALPRVQAYHLTNYPFPGRYILQRAINTVLPKRKLPNNLVLVGRSQWFTASVNCIKYIIDYWEQHPALRRFMKFTWAPDEFIFQTILYNSPLKGEIIHDDLRYIDWSGGGVSPKLLTMQDADRLLSSGKLFARKFDVMKDSAVLDYIDKHR